MKSSLPTKRKRRRPVRASLAERAGELVGRRVVFIRDNQFVKAARGRKAAG